MPSKQEHFGMYTNHNPQRFFDRYDANLYEWHLKNALREQQNDDLIAVALPPPQIEQTLRVAQPRRAHRTSHVVDGRLHVVNAALLLSTQSLCDDTRDHIGYPFPFTLVRKPPYQHDPTLKLLEGSSHGTLPTDDSLSQLNEDLPSARVLPEIEPPDSETWGPSIDTLKARRGHDELFFELDASYCLPPQALKNAWQIPHELLQKLSDPHENETTETMVHELPADVPYSSLHQIEPTKLALLTSRSYLLQHGFEAQLAILDSWQDAENAQECSDIAAVSRQSSPVPRGVATVGALFQVSDKPEDQKTPIYAQYTKMRKWDYEELEEPYNNAVNGITTPPPSPPARHSEGVEWFYGTKG
jgi:hypothetical protein